MPGPLAVKWKSLQGPSARDGAGPKFPQTPRSLGRTSHGFEVYPARAEQGLQLRGEPRLCSIASVRRGRVRQLTALWSRAALLLRRLRMSGLVFTLLLENRERGRHLGLPEPRWERGGWRVYSASLRPGAEVCS